MTKSDGQKPWLELARAIASPTNPLTARVLANRVWRHHFGAALVRTPSDFGTRADPPTHPDLLDWLATRLVEDGWAVRVLEGAGFPDAVVDQVRDLERWLAAFPAEAMLELDYASVSDHFPDADLTFDESSADVRESLEALERGDGSTSRTAYARVAGRWAGRQALTFAN